MTSRLCGRPWGFKVKIESSHRLAVIQFMGRLHLLNGLHSVDKRTNIYTHPQCALKMNAAFRVNACTVYHSADTSTIRAYGIFLTEAFFLHGVQKALVVLKGGGDAPQPEALHECHVLSVGDSRGAAVQNSRSRQSPEIPRNRLLIRHFYVNIQWLFFTGSISI